MLVKVIKMHYVIPELDYFSELFVGKTGKVKDNYFDKELKIDTYLVEIKFGNIKLAQYIPKSCCEVVEKC